MTNIIGPHGAGVNETTSRPTDAASGAGSDSWFKDCVGGAPGTGTKPPAVWFNKVTAQLRRAIRGMGVTEDELDDDMLLKAIQAAQSTNVEILLANLPTFPEILAGGNVLGVSTSTGQIVISTGQPFLWRGFKKFNTTDFSGAERTIITTASKTYHLRWYAPGHANAPVLTYPKGRFMLRDLADNVLYNPGALVEYSDVFDSTYDDMLIGRVVTSGANAPTFTALANKHRLSASITGASRSHLTIEVSHTYNFTLAWARTPKLALSAMRPPANSFDSDYDIRAVYQRREAIEIYSWSWHHSNSTTYADQSPGFSFEMWA